MWTGGRGEEQEIIICILYVHTACARINYVLQSDGKIETFEFSRNTVKTTMIYSRIAEQRKC